MKRYLCGWLALLIASASHAQWEIPPNNQGFYAGAAVSRLHYDQLSPAGDDHLQALEFNTGYWHNPLISVDVRLGTGLGDDVIDVGATRWEVAVESFGSVYWRPEVANDVAKLYGLLGYSRVEIDATSPEGGSRSFSDSGPSFGAGVGFFYTQDVVLNLEWKQLIDADGFEIDGFSAGFDYRF